METALASYEGKWLLRSCADALSREAMQYTKPAHTGAANRLRGRCQAVPLCIEPRPSAKGPLLDKCGGMTPRPKVIAIHSLLDKLSTAEQLFFLLYYVA